MKRNLTFLILLFSILIAKGNHNSSSLNLRMNNSSLFTVVFDNVPYHQPVSQFNLNEIYPGCHQITVYKIKHHGYYNTYPVLVYSGVIDIPAASIVNAVVKPHCLDIVNVSPVCAPVVTPPCYAPVFSGMSQPDFEELKYVINSKSFDSSKLAIAKDAVRNQNITSRQLSEIMGLLTFDSSRLELAKYAYRHVADPSSYYLIYDQFTFESSVTELIDYINHNS